MPALLDVDLWQTSLLLAASGVLSLAVGWLALHATPLRRLVPDDAASEGYKQQKTPVPLVGGFCLAAVTISAGSLLPLVASTRWSLPFLVGMALALLLGFLDDAVKRRGLPWMVKLVGQAVAAGSFLLYDTFHAPAPVPAGLGVVWLVVCMNAWNFLDNTDGVATATGLAVALALLLVGAGADRTTWWTVLLAGSLLGFLPLNWPRPRAYLGDSGAHALGFAFGWFSLELCATHGVHGLVALHALPLLDMAQVVIVRLGLGIPPWRGDRRHLAHRLRSLLPAGLPEASVAPVFFGVQAALTSLLVILGAGGTQ